MKNQENTIKRNCEKTKTKFCEKLQKVKKYLNFFEMSKFRKVESRFFKNFSKTNSKKFPKN